MSEITWMIHGVFDTKNSFEKMNHKQYPHLGNFHTHGLNEYNNQRELCIVLALEGKVAAGLLNSMGVRLSLIHI